MQMFYKTGTIHGKGMLNEPKDTVAERDERERTNAEPRVQQQPERSSGGNGGWRGCRKRSSRSPSSIRPID
jgi:hypothetical protein